jgi:clan AA aspartic protease
MEMRLRILLAEDNRDNQNLAKTILQKAGYRVDVAENGRIAVEAFRACHYDLILMDIQMPEMDGFTATGEIRRIEKEFNSERVPIIAFTACAVPGCRENCIEAGCTDYLSKPIKKAGLLEIIHKYVHEEKNRKAGGDIMGHVYAEITLKNPRLPKLKTVIVQAMVDTGALTLCIPEHIALQLKLEMNNQREVTTADGRRQMVPYAGPIEVLFENRNCFVGALVLGDEVLLGAVPMEDMDLIISPGYRKLIVNPDSPNFPHALVK